MLSRKPAIGVAAIGLAFVVGSVASCTTSSQTGGAMFAPSPSQCVTLSVNNRNPENVRIYILHASTRIPVGSVGGFQSRKFTISRAVVGASNVLHLWIVTTPSRREISLMPITVEPGQTVEAWIATSLKNSAVSLRTQTL